jgi:2-polyprenyl-3-methyl-5-hydroxy-6-metoxy-1,4-benzoquinol methylase
VKAKKKFAERFVGITPKDFGELEDRQRKVLEIFSSYQFERILDVGCGDGNFTTRKPRPSGRGWQERLIKALVASN